MVINEVSCAGKKVILRIDLNLPRNNNKITDYTRLLRVIPTLQYLLQQNARIIIISHLGRPQDKYDTDLSLAPIADEIQNLLNTKVKFCVEHVGVLAQKAVTSLKDGEILLLENLRFSPQEKQNCQVFAKELASLGDLYVNDAFSCSHRAHASLHAITNYLPSFYGLSLVQELDMIKNLIDNASSPVTAIIGGAKISTKLILLNSLLDMVDNLVISGAMANNFLKAQGYEIGNSFIEEGYVKEAANLIELAKFKGVKLILPQDVVVFSELMGYDIKNPKEIIAQDFCGDVGPKTLQDIIQITSNSKTVIWNGPLGMMEENIFTISSTALARAIASLTKNNNLISVAGGGDVVAAIKQTGLSHHFTYLSTGGGAFLQWLEDHNLPALEALKLNQQKFMYQ